METSQVRILLVDDHTLFREGVVRLLSAEADFEVVGHCSTVDEAIEALAESSVDIVLLDIDLGAERGTHPGSHGRCFPAGRLLLAPIRC